MQNTKQVAVAPTRQGFYWAELASGELALAEYREYEKSQGKVWWVYESIDPTVQKERVLLTAPVCGYSKAGEQEVSRALTRALTVDEQVQAAYTAYAGSRDTNHPWSMPIPASRQLCVGQQVEVGHLQDAQVAGLFEDGQVVVVQYQLAAKKGSDRAPALALLGKCWVDVLPTVPLIPGLSADRKFTQAEMSTHLGHLVHRLYQDGALDSPDYQRGYAWTEEDKHLYYDSVFQGRNVGRFIFVVDINTNSIEVLDGKQRLNAMLELLTSTTAYRGVYWHQMTREDRSKVESRLAQFVDLQKHDYSRADLLQIFLEVNAAGVPQSPEHLEYVRGLLAEELGQPER